MWQFWIDRGGTFTDVIGISPAGALQSTKVLSSDTAAITGIKTLLNVENDTDIPPCSLKMGTTVATNALLERNGAKVGLAITTGFADILEIGTQQRPDLFNLNIQKPSTLYEAVAEIDERVSADGAIQTAPDPTQIQSDLQPLIDAGIKSLAIVCCHGHQFPEHEQKIAQTAQSMGFDHIICSHQISPEIGLTSRGDTTTMDAYLTPLIWHYLRQYQEKYPQIRIQLMGSNGALAPPSDFRGPDAVLSGPAGGVIGVSAVSKLCQQSKLIGFDMGGTSTDVSRFDGAPEMIYETEIAGVRLKRPLINIHTIAAGGGSICHIQGGRLTVGPDSAGSYPGPICYGLKDKAGNFAASQLTISDINAFLGRLHPDNFPFDLHLDRVNTKLVEIQDQLRITGHHLSLHEIAYGFLNVANSKMAQAVKKITVAKGYDARAYALCSFGGAGTQHCCAVAQELDIKKIVIHPFAGILSAFGIGAAPRIWHHSIPIANHLLTTESETTVHEQLAPYLQTGIQHLQNEGFDRSEISTQIKLDLRYQNTWSGLTITQSKTRSYHDQFTAQHQKEFGHTKPLPIEITQARIEVTGHHLPPDTKAESPPRTPAQPVKTVPLFTQSQITNAPVYQLSDISETQTITGPAIVLNTLSTLIVEPNWTLNRDPSGCYMLTQSGAPTVQPRVIPKNPVHLEIFNNLFMSIAEQMGEQLRRTAQSTNIKERLDYSCALFDQNGYLVANAPHIPVHLGAMGETVRAVKTQFPNMAPGDAYLTNHPAYGGSHLPDLTVVSPLFANSDTTPTFYVASRAHHEDIGGKVPGSMPVGTTFLSEEGVVIAPCQIGSQWRADSPKCRQILTQSRYPARNPNQNIADLNAQIAANHQADKLIAQMICHYGLETIVGYMGHVRENAKTHVALALKPFLSQCPLSFSDQLDDGTQITVQFTCKNGRLCIDFSGTNAHHPQNFNAPTAVAKSAILYTLRALVDAPIPLNEGCLDAVDIRIPPDSLLNPPPEAAVAAGNVETSQRIVDVLLGAFGIAAASQGTMNNISFGNASFGYYETIGGGAGATAKGTGANGVHTHMTNTRITDVEILESQFPVEIVAFQNRKQSGGAGQFNGGDGLIRHLKFKEETDVSILSGRRTCPPYGLNGATPGKAGENNLKRGSKKIQIPGIWAFKAHPSDELIIQTPGGGGFTPIAKKNL